MREDEKLRIALLRGAELLLEHNLSDWKIKIDNRTAVLAETWHSDKVIVISKKFITVADKEQFDGTVYHEIAHALLGRGYGHGKEFIEMYTKISSNPEYAKRGASVGTRKYILTCPSCGYTGSHNSPNISMYCGRCHAKDGSLNKFVITKNKLEVKVWA